MDQRQELDQTVEKWNLLNHPFYQAWSMGTLSVESLGVYAREYGAFIQLLPLGWQTLHDSETAREEAEHAEHWSHFAEALNAGAAAAEIAQIRSLVDTSRRLFSSPASALGALYAFEVQQPATARSKLDGLQKWYKVPAAAEEYFAIHAANWHESQKILAEINLLSPEEQRVALEACAEMSEALWNGLTGIYDQNGAHS